MNEDMGHTRNQIALYEHIPVAILLIDSGARIGYINPCFTRLSGYFPEDLIGWQMGTLCSREWDPQSRLEVEECISKGIEWRGEMLFRYKNGSLHRLSMILMPQRNAEQAVTGFILMQQDAYEREAIENALLESEAKYKTLVENSHDGIMIVRDRRILYANDTLCNMLGHCHTEKILEMIHPEDLPKIAEIAQRRRSGDPSTIHETIRIIAPNGEIKVCESTSTMIRFEGEWAAFYTIHDVTARTRFEAELRRSERKYRELTEMLPLAVYELDAQGVSTYVNQTGLRMFGYQQKITAGKDAVSFFSEEDRNRMRHNLKVEAERLLNREGNVEAIASPPVEYTARKADGTNCPVLIYGTAIIEEGHVVGSRGIIVDISERKAMEDALRESEEKYRSLIENATDGIVIVQDGRLKFANQTMCDIMGYSLNELLEKPFLNYIDPSEHQSLSQFHARRMRGEQFSNILRSCFIRKDKKCITVELNARTLNFNGSPAGFIVIRDITERLNIEHELQVAKKELERLNSQLEKRVKESSKRLTEAKTQLINLQKENLQSQFDVLKQQVNPHFLFNSLNVLTSLIKLEPDLAEKFSEQLSKVYRYVLENKDNELVDLNTELYFLDAYIFLLNIRFLGKLVVNITIPEERRNDRIIPLAMQLLIENAIKHNIMSKSNPLVIDIFVDAHHYLNIINNLQERPSQIVSTGVGLKNILNRYQLLKLPVPSFEKSGDRFVAKIKLVKHNL